jgi:hypothetical protein
LEQNLRDAYKPIALLQRIRPPNFYFARFTSDDAKLTSCRGLRQAANRLIAFEKLTLAEISAELEAQDRETRERSRNQRRQCASAFFEAAPFGFSFSGSRPRKPGRRLSRHVYRSLMV